MSDASPQGKIHEDGLSLGKNQWTLGTSQNAAGTARPACSLLPDNIDDSFGGFNFALSYQRSPIIERLSNCKTFCRTREVREIQANCIKTACEAFGK